MNRQIYVLLAVVLAVHSATIDSKIHDGFRYVTKISDQKLDWWQNGVFYEIYIRTFKDSDGDGIGDIQGVIQKLNYLHDTGITAVWLSPIFKSSKIEQGYDVSDYLDLDPIFGTLNDFKELLEKAHDLGIRIILDFVPNHTSDQHIWFQLSENRTEGYEDFYVWRDGENVDDDIQVPNNWISVYGGSAWEWSEIRKQYYLHQFSKHQPDLNYENPLVIDAMKNIVLYWLEFGVDGFKVDDAAFIFEDSDFDNEPLVIGQGEYDVNNYTCLNHTYTRDQNKTFELFYQFRELLENYTESHNVETKVLVTVAESPILQQLRYLGKTSGGVRVQGAHFTYNFNFITMLSNENFTITDVYDSISQWILFTFISRFTCSWVLGNQDYHRVATRLGQENVDSFNMLIAILPGVMVSYNGEEIGMENGEVTCEQGQDPHATDCRTFDIVSRDFERTPFQWDNSTNAGFTNGTPWLPVSKKASEVNLADQDVEGFDSHYNIYKELLNFRQIFSYYSNTYEVGARVETENIFRVERGVEKGRFYLYFNIGGIEDSTKIEYDNIYFKVIVTSIGSTYSPGDLLLDKVTLQPHESIIVQELFSV